MPEEVNTEAVEVADLPPEFTLSIGGKDRRAVADYNALVEAEAITGRSVLHAFSTLKNIPPTDIVAIVYAVLKSGNPRDPELSMDSVSEWLDLSNFNKVIQTIAGNLSRAVALPPGSLAPFVPTATNVVLTAIELAKKFARSTGVFVDLGCGEGGVLSAAGEAGFKNLIGYETDLDRAAKTQAILQSKAGVDGYAFAVKQQDLRDAAIDVSIADVVFVYLLPASNEEIRAMLEGSLKSGAVVVSHDFSFNWPVDWLVASETVMMTEKVSTVYVYRVPQFDGLVN